MLEGPFGKRKLTAIPKDTHTARRRTHDVRRRKSKTTKLITHRHSVTVKRGGDSIDQKEN